MSKAAVYTVKGTKKQAMTLPKIFSEKENMVLLAQALRVYKDNKHGGLSKVKTRSEVTASTRKIYRQKGTGRARHGALSAPIFVGGGKAHGPKGVKRSLSIPKKMRRKARDVALSIKAKEGKVIVIDGFSKLKKTKEMAFLLDKITKKEKNVGDKSRFTIALSKDNKEIIRCIKNISNASVLQYQNINALEAYLGGVLLIDIEAIKKNRGTVGADKKKTTKGKNITKTK